MTGGEAGSSLSSFRPVLLPWAFIALCLVATPLRDGPAGRCEAPRLLFPFLSSPHSPSLSTAVLLLVAFWLLWPSGDVYSPSPSPFLDLWSAPPTISGTPRLHTVYVTTTHDHGRTLVTMTSEDDVPLRRLSPRSTEAAEPSPACDALKDNLRADDGGSGLKKRKSWFGSMREVFHKGALQAKAAVDSMRGDGSQVKGEEER